MDTKKFKILPCANDPWDQLIEEQLQEPETELEPTYEVTREKLKTAMLDNFERRDYCKWTGIELDGLMLVHIDLLRKEYVYTKFINEFNKWWKWVVTYKHFTDYPVFEDGLSTQLREKFKQLVVEKTDYYVFHYPIETKIPKGTIVVEGDIEILTYSKSSIAIFGDVRKIHAELYAAGGRFAKKLTHPLSGERVQGWLFPKTKSITVKSVIN